MTASVLILGGPTAAGKSDLAVELALRFDARIVSADAMTVFRGLDVGTAKPDAETLARVTHDCIDVCELDEHFSVADFVAATRRAAAEAGRVIVVGGTPFYLRALVAPLARLPPAAPTLRAELEAIEDLHAALAAVDPPAAARLHPNDRVRLVRALEVHRLTGRTLTDIHAENATDPVLAHRLVWLDRAGLRERIGLRLEAMLAGGYVEETQRALARVAGEVPRPLRSFSYRHLVESLQGDLDLAEAVRRTERDTWRFARKQRTWARSQGWEASTPNDARAVAEQVFAG